MSLSNRNRWVPRLGLVMAAVLIPSLVLAAGPEKKRALKMGEFNPEHETVEMFAAIKSGQIEVQLIPKDSTLANIRIANKTNQPLNVRLPEAFAGIPASVLAQMGGQGGMGGQMGGQQQGMGGGMGGQGGQMGGQQGGGGGGWNVAPEKVAHFKVPAVCLDHGKKEPHAKMHYVIRPLEEYTDNPAVHQLCRMIGTGQLNQRAAQVAAWHLNNGMSGQELAAKKIRHANGTTEPYFTRMELMGGYQIAQTAIKLAEKHKKGEDTSLSMR